MKSVQNKPPVSCGWDTNSCGQSSHTIQTCVSMTSLLTGIPGTPR